MCGKACCFIKNDLNLPLFLTRDLIFKRIKLKTCFVAFVHLKIMKYKNITIFQSKNNSIIYYLSL